MYLINVVLLFSQALENEDAAPFSESEALAESECDVMSDSTLSDGTSRKDMSLRKKGKTVLG